jgi:hypothetical protein
MRPYLRLANLSNTGYQEIVGVAMPGRSITGGVRFVSANEFAAWFSRTQLIC